MSDLERDGGKDQEKEEISRSDEGESRRINWQEEHRIYPRIRTASDFYETARLTREKLIHRAAHITSHRKSYEALPTRNSDSSDSENDANKNSKVGSIPANYSTLLAQPRQESKVPDPRESLESKGKPPMKIVELESKSKKPDAPKQDFWGILMAFLAGAAFTMSAVGIKLVNRMDPTMILLVRVCIQSALLIPYTIFHRRNSFSVAGHRLLLFSLGIVGSGVLIFCFIAYARLPVGDATAIIFSSPILVIVLSRFIFKEPCGVCRLIAIILLSAGIILISRPSAIFAPDAHFGVNPPFVDLSKIPNEDFFIQFQISNVSSPELEALSSMAEKQNLTLLIVPNPNDLSDIVSLLQAVMASVPTLMKNFGLQEGATCTNTTNCSANNASSSEIPEIELILPPGTEYESMDTFGVVAAMLSTTCMAVNYIITRQLKDVHHSTVLVIYSCMAVVSCSIVVAATDTFDLPENAYEWGVIVGISLSGLTGQVLLVLSLKRQIPSVVAVVRSFDIVLAYVFQVLLFNDIPRLSSLGGAAFVMIAVLIVTFEYHLKQLFSCPCATENHT